MPVGTGASALTGQLSATVDNIGSSAKIELEAAEEAKVLIAAGSKNPAVAVAGDTELGIQTPPFVNNLNRPGNRGGWLV